MSEDLSMMCHGLVGHEEMLMVDSYLIGKPAKLKAMARPGVKLYSLR